MELRRTLMDRLLTLDVGFHEHHHSGELASRLTSDVARVEDVVVSISSVVVPELLTLIGIVVIMLGLDPPLAVAAALVVPLLWAVTVRRRRAVRVAERLSRDEAGRLSARGTELVRNAAIVQAFGQQPLVLRRYAHQNRRALDSAVAAVTVEARYRASPLLRGTAGQREQRSACHNPTANSLQS